MPPESIEKNTTSFLRQVSDFFSNHTDNEGNNICFKHHIEHVGKTVYSIPIDLFLYRKTGNKKYIEQAKSRALHIASKQKKQFGDHIFGIPNFDRWNMSNGMIDSGAACDSLSTLLDYKDNGLTTKEQKDIWAAVEKVCDSYLESRVDIKCHTNQRLWGATGLAAAYTYRPKNSWKKAVIRSVEVSFSEIREDGSIPYVTDFKENNYPVGIQDTTTYYHSRHIAYAWYALEKINELTEERVLQMKPAVDFLVGMYQENGVKSIQLETKRWYFNSNYEVGSHAYDVYVLAKFYAYTKDPIYAHYGKKAYQKLCEHQVRLDGGVRDHIGGVENFQCPYFWNSHCAWLSRIDKELLEMLQAPDHDVCRIKHFPTSDVVQVVKSNYACLLRGRKQPANPQWGPRVGGGSLLYFGSLSNDFVDEKLSARDGVVPYGNFIWQQKMPSSIKFLQDYKRAVRSSIFYVLVEIRARDIRSAWFRLVTLCRTVFLFNAQFSSAYYIDVKTEFSKDSVQFNSGMSRMDGAKIPGIDVTRVYSFSENEVQVEERFTSDKPISSLKYILHPHSTKVKVNCNANHRIKKGAIKFYGLVTELTISYQLR